MEGRRSLSSVLRLRATEPRSSARSSAVEFVEFVGGRAVSRVVLSEHRDGLIGAIVSGLRLKGPRLKALGGFSTRAAWRSSLAVWKGYRGDNDVPTAACLSAVAPRLTALELPIAICIQVAPRFSSERHRLTAERRTLIDQAQRVRSAPSSLAADVRFSSRRRGGESSACCTGRSSGLDNS
jgi:hypothetical protein